MMPSPFEVLEVINTNKSLRHNKICCIKSPVLIKLLGAFNQRELGVAIATIQLY
jgi:hypothetical protein